MKLTQPQVRRTEIGGYRSNVGVEFIVFATKGANDSIIASALGSFTDLEIGTFFSF